jgi:hypothetical protein
VDAGPEPSAIDARALDASATDLSSVGDAAPSDMRPVADALPEAITTSGALTSKICTGAGWCWADTELQSNALTAIWGSGARDVWAVGLAGTILHWDGAGWSPSASGTTADLYDVRGSAADDVWIVGDGTLLHWDGSAWSAKVPTLTGPGGGTLTTASQPLRGVWAAAANDVWVMSVAYGVAPATEYLMLHWDGNTWAVVPGINGATLSFWGSGSDDVWAFSSIGADHWDGHAWMSIELPFNTFANGRAGGTGPSDVWIPLGYSPGLVHYDGTAWSQVPGTPSDNLLMAAFGAGRGDVWAVGAGGTIVHWDGHALSDVSSPTTQDLADVWGTAANDVWAVGAGGTILHWDGSAWSRSMTTDAVAFRGVWGIGANDVWAVGRDSLHGTAAHWNGSSWAESIVVSTGVEKPAPNGFGEPALEGIWGASANDIWAVGTSGAGNEIVHFDGQAWSSFDPGPDPDTLVHGLHAVWGSASDDVWAVGGAGIVQIRHWNGTRWTSETTGFTNFQGTVYGRCCNAVWGSGPDDVWAAGGDVWHWDGTRWTSFANPDPNVDFYSLWGAGPKDVWAVGIGNTPHGAIFHWDGVMWREVMTSDVPLWAVWGRSPNDITAVGGDGLGLDNVAHFDGQTWTFGQSGTRNALSGVWGDPNDVFIVGAGGVLLHH